MTILLLLFQFGFFLFLFLLWFLWLKLPKLCWIVAVKVGTLVLFLTFEEMLSVFHHWGYYLLWVYHIWLLLCWGMFLLCLLSGGFFFIINWCWIFSKAFSASIEIIIWLLSLNLLMWCITLIDLQLLKNPCISGINPTWSWCMIFLMCCWILIARILLRILHLCLSVILACSFLVLWHLCQVLVLGWWWPHRMSLEIYSPLQFSGRVWVG